MKKWFWLALLHGLALIAELASFVLMVQDSRPFIASIADFGLVLIWPLLILTFFGFIFSMARNSNVRILIWINAGLATILSLGSLNFGFILIVMVIALLVMKKGEPIVKSEIQPMRRLNNKERGQMVMTNPSLKKLNRISILAQAVPVALLVFGFVLLSILAFSLPDPIKFRDILESLVIFCLFILLDILALIAFIRIDRSGNTFATISLFVNGIGFFLFFGWLIGLSVLDESGNSLNISTQMFKTAFWYFIPLYLIPKIVALYGSIKLHNSIFRLTKGQKSAKITAE